ncbi:thermonuclease family protein [Pinibacter aurantiacus]|uniref:Thermonuclease family protein n=1 Tax=Pinibacter aurantiacus TaxID=2851599 RepID=A0A9E2SBX6_9BACT|nr:thermonuclease family protein [Pinibacter aurantiacus]MBV4357560.1 thermonuclease family protein [Pinibacter aurantiacus]
MRTFLFSLLLIFTINVSAQTLKGKVVKVSDGDTITILDSVHHQIKIRLYGIDCPEKKQDYGTVAKNFTADRCFSKVISVVSKGKDKYGRTLGVVILPDKSELNLLLLQRGLAWHYKTFDKSIRYAGAELNAKQQKYGLWAGKNPVAPWEFRKEGSIISKP